MLRNTYFFDKDFTRWMLHLAFPSAVQSLLAVSVGALNNLLTGHYFGEVEMSAVSQAATVFAIYEVLTYGFAASCGVLVAQYWGKRDGDTINDVIAIAVRLEAALGLVFAAVMLLAPSFVMSLMSKDPAVIALGSEYLRITAPTYFLFGIINALYSSYRSVELVQLVFWGNTLCYSVNLLLSWLLVPTNGVAGAATAALCARCVDIAFVTVCLFSSKRLRFKPSTLLHRRDGLLGDFFNVCYPIMGHELIWSVGNNMPQILMGRISTSAVSAYSIASTANSVLSFLYSGIGGAAMVIVGKRIGEGDKPRAMKSAKTFLLYAVLAGAAASATMYLIRPLFLSFYDVSPEVLGYADGFMKVLSVAIFFSAFDVIALVSTLRAGGMGKVGLITDIFVMWMLGVPLGWLAALKWNLSPVWVVALVKVDMPLKAIIGAYIVAKRDWIRNLTHGAPEQGEANAG